jgi:hypothetical protein
VPRFPAGYELHEETGYELQEEETGYELHVDDSVAFDMVLPPETVRAVQDALLPVQDAILPDSAAEWARQAVDPRPTANTVGNCIAVMGGIVVNFAAGVSSVQEDPTRPTEVHDPVDMREVDLDATLPSEPYTTMMDMVAWMEDIQLDVVAATDDDISDRERDERDERERERRRQEEH